MTPNDVFRCTSTSSQNFALVLIVGLANMGFPEAEKIYRFENNFKIFSLLKP